MKHELSSMKAFVILAESSSFNNAAKLLNITQPALTRRIKKMEEDLHIQLFERTTRKVTLTKAGKRLLPEARELIKKFDETLFNIRDPDELNQKVEMREQSVEYHGHNEQKARH